MQVIQSDAGNDTVRGNKRHLNRDNNNETGQEKPPPSFNDRSIEAGYIFLNLDTQRGDGPQRPLKPLCHEADFIDNDAPLIHIEPYEPEQDQ